MASLQGNSTFSFKHNLTGEAWPACRAILPFHSNTTWQARHGQLAEQFYVFIQTPLDRRGMASLQSNSTFSFKHHSTGKACLAWSLHIVRTSTIAKNRHLNIVLRAELYLRTGTYDRPKNTLAIDSAYPARLCPGDRCARRRWTAWKFRNEWR